MADKREVTRIITPAFVATMCYLTTPSQFGKYTVRGTFDPKNPEHRKFLKQLKELHKVAVADARPKFKPTKKQKELEVFDCMTENDDEPTFYVQMSETAIIEWTDKKSGEKKTANLKPAIVDAKGQPCDVDVWQGSTLKAALDVAGFFNAGKCGLSLRLKGVQVLYLVTRGARDLGFGVEEGGFDSADFMAQPQKAASKADALDDDDDDTDDFNSDDDGEYVAEKVDTADAAPGDLAGEGTDDFDF